MRRRYIWRNGDWVPADSLLKKRGTAGPQLMPDLREYKSAITGEIVSGRRQHRDHLRRHNCIEVGNEKPRAPSVTTAPGLKQDIAAAMRQLGFKD
ncbi:MAG: hypothetical protein AB7G80_05045 [Dongiaceae bacterium]